MLMELVGLTLSIAFGLLLLLGVFVHVRKACLHSQVRSLRDRGEHRYQRVDQHAPGVPLQASA